MFGTFKRKLWPMNSSKPAPATRRSARQQTKREAVRAEILAAARKIVLSKGVNGTTLDGVAEQAGMSKAALYYYFKSKDALLFELVLDIHAAQADALNKAVGQTSNGSEALGALITSMVGHYRESMEDFRLAYLYGQTSADGAVTVGADQLERIRPLNDLMLAEAARLVGENSGGPAAVPPRLLAFLAYACSIGLLTMKGMVESIDDPLLYSDAELVDALATVFATAVDRPDSAT